MSEKTRIDNIYSVLSVLFFRILIYSLLFSIAIEQEDMKLFVRHYTTSSTLSSLSNDVESPVVVDQYWQESVTMHRLIFPPNWITIPFLDECGEGIHDIAIKSRFSLRPTSTTSVCWIFLTSSFSTP